MSGRSELLSQHQLTSMKILNSLLLLLAFTAGTGHAASLLNFNSGAANSITGDPLGVSLMVDYAYLETEDEFGDPLPVPRWVADATAPSPVLLSNPATQGYGAAIDGLALDGVLSPVLLSFGSGLDISAFSLTLDNSTLGTLFGTSIEFYNALDALIWSIPVDQTVAGFSVNESLALLGVSKIVMPSGAFYDNVSITATPEPSRIILLGVGALCAFGRRRRAVVA